MVDSVQVYPIGVVKQESGEAVPIGEVHNEAISLQPVVQVPQQQVIPVTANPVEVEEKVEEKQETHKKKKRRRKPARVKEKKLSRAEEKILKKGVKRAVKKSRGINIKNRLKKPKSVKPKPINDKREYVREGIILMQEEEFSKDALFPHVKNEDERVTKICSFVTKLNRQVAESLGYDTEDLEFGCVLTESVKAGKEVVAWGIKVKKEKKKKYKV